MFIPKDIEQQNLPHRKCDLKVPKKITPATFETLYLIYPQWRDGQFHKTYCIKIGKKNVCSSARAFLSFLKKCTISYLDVSSTFTAYSCAVTLRRVDYKNHTVTIEQYSTLNFGEFLLPIPSKEEYSALVGHKVGDKVKIPERNCTIEIVNVHSRARPY